MKYNYFIISVICVFSFISCKKENNQAAEKHKTVTYEFTDNMDGWTGDFADYPVTDSISFELECIRTTLPYPLQTSKYALRISGNNHSDDLFMFIKRKITGLIPNTTYTLLIDVELASTYATSDIGVGGSPGKSVIVKAGASITEPIKVNKNGEYRMNIDKGNQAVPGADMDTIGNVGVTDTTTIYTLIHRSNANNLFTITTGASGAVWVCIGTDSGYEATTTLYYSKIRLSFEAQ
jgi:hypothetical protein